MKLLCGLGNPGPEYAFTRHNAGFLFLDHWAKHYDLSFTEHKGALVTEHQLSGEKIFLLKPLTFMNRSGVLLRLVADYYKIPSTSICVIYDDVDLPLGTVRFRDKGSAGTHNGMRSVVQHMGTEEIPRLRMGIESRGDLSPKEMNLHSFVLSAFLDEEWPLFESACREGAEILEKRFVI